jgi:hypothetical protein
LKLAQRLEAAGMAAPVDAGASEALAEAMSGAELATKSDLQATEAAWRADMKAFELAVRSDMKASEASMQGEMELLRRDLTTRLGGMMILGVGIMLTAMRVMFHP